LAASECGIGRPVVQGYYLEGWGLAGLAGGSVIGLA
jgi:hypothetical protein